MIGRRSSRIAIVAMKAGHHLGHRLACSEELDAATVHIRDAPGNNSGSELPGGRFQGGADAGRGIASVVDPFRWLDAVEKFLVADGVGEVDKRFGDG